MIGHRAKQCAERSELGRLQGAARRHFRLHRGQRGLELFRLQAAPGLGRQFAHKEAFRFAMVFVVVARVAAVAFGLPQFRPTPGPVNRALKALRSDQGSDDEKRVHIAGLPVLVESPVVNDNLNPATTTI